ncbi:MAG: cell division protein FtsA [Spirochaetaceae bacterium]|nr:cell division protein FtsA [Spirochaetaceae bacterium]
MSFPIVGLDIGTSFVRAVIAELSEDSELRITGFGKAPSSNGLRNGIIVNIVATARAISEAIESAELIAGTQVTSCFVAIGGSQIEGVNRKGVAPVAARGSGGGEISRKDVESAIETARAVKFPTDRQILHVVPQSYTVDDEPGIKDPVNMMGVRLEVNVHIVTASMVAVQNVRTCMSRAGYDLGGIMLKTLAATQAVLTAEEMELGSIIIDIGGGTTDALVVYEGAPVCSASIPFGGIHITRDIGVGKLISFEAAEKIKKTSGCCWPDLVENYDDVIIPRVGGKPPEVIPPGQLCVIIQARMEEILRMIRSEIVRKSTVSDLSGNIVLIGGGAALPGAVELTQKVFSTGAVRVGKPVAAVPDSLAECRESEYAAAVGLVLSAAPGGALNVVTGEAKPKAPLEKEKDTPYNGRKKSAKPLGEVIVDYWRELF